MFGLLGIDRLSPDQRLAEMWIYVYVVVRLPCLVTLGSVQNVLFRYPVADVINEPRPAECCWRKTWDDEVAAPLNSRTTLHEGYARSQKKRKRIEECFGWLKTVALLRKVRHRGTLKVDWIFTFALACGAS